MNAILKNISDFFVSLASTEQSYEPSYPAHEIEHFLLKLNTQFDLNIKVIQAMELVNSLKPDQVASTTLEVLFCGCPHTVKFDCARRSDGITMRFKSASMPLDHAINSELKHLQPSRTIASMKLAHVA